MIINIAFIYTLYLQLIMTLIMLVIEIKMFSVIFYKIYVIRIYVPTTY